MFLFKFALIPFKFEFEIDKIALSLNYDKRIQSIDSIETYAHRQVDIQK